MININKLSCEVDDFCQQFIPAWQKSLISTGDRLRIKPRRLTESEVITLLVLFHQYRFRDFEIFYTQYARVHLNEELPDLLSYTRILKLLQNVMVPLSSFLVSRYAKPTE